MGKLDPIKAAERIRADLKDEFDAELEKAIRDSEEKAESGKQNKQTEDIVKEADEAGELELADKIKMEEDKKEETEQGEVVEKKKTDIKKETGIILTDKEARLLRKAGNADSFKKMSEEEKLKLFEINEKIKKEKGKRDAEKEKVGTRDKYRDEYFEEMKNYKPEKKGEKEVSPKAETEEEEKESSGEKLEALSEELRKAREEYIKNDFEMDRKSNKFSRMFGFRTGLGNYKKEIENYKNDYEKALKNYKDAVIDSEYVEDKEDIEIVMRGFMISEKLNVESRRDELKIEDSSFSEKTKKNVLDKINKYRALSWKKKIAIGASLAIGGAALSGATFLVAGAGAGATVMAGSLALRKMFSIAISSVGFDQMFGAGRQMTKKVMIERDIKKKLAETMSETEKFQCEKLSEILGKELEKLDGRIQNEKMERTFQVWASIGAGATMTLVFGKFLGEKAGELLRNAKEYVGETEMGKYAGTMLENIGDKIGELWKEHGINFHGGAPESTEGSGEVNPEAIKTGAAGALHHDLKFDTLGEAATGTEVAETVRGIEIAKSGDSVWKLAENQLEGRGYFKNLTGTPEEILAKKTYLIDAIKDKIAESPKDFGMTNANELQIGQKIDFSGIFENKNDIGNIIDEAESLGKGDMESITQNLAGESPLHGVGAETAAGQAEMPVAGAPIEMPVSEDDVKYLAGVLQQETAETIRTCAGNNIDAWNNIKNVLVVDSGQNEVVENLRIAVSKTLPEGVAVPSKNDTVEDWMIKITNEAYKRESLDELREQLVKLRK